MSKTIPKPLQLTVTRMCEKNNLKSFNLKRFVTFCCGLLIVQDVCTRMFMPGLSSGLKKGSTKIYIFSFISHGIETFKFSVHFDIFISTAEAVKSQVIGI